ncbi:MAG TPA: glycerophosphodiester phosphodiesterase family protein [Planctomycetota bacterium]|nr:glycerophosphodiester phosphodiesterase family protein [Planctomycetota bacterium]HRR82732.1 glycerophosphodiester phosphodiesterase family protein [Planctomycetota bacterium]HRT97437.1 glycerophosphodiester phosphodiesterase family protein [Planctomycetota bacterium]
MAVKPLVVGHRGWLQRYPENTLVSLRAALELGVDALEFDLHLSRDGHLVVIHDATLERTTDGTGRVGERTLAELKRLDAGAWFAPRFAGERIPTLEEVLGLVPPGVALYAEVKDTRPEMAAALLPFAQARADAMIVHSFGADFLEAFRRLAPSAVRIGLLGNVTKLDLGAAARRLRCWGIHPCMEALTREQVAAWQAEGFRVMCWTVRNEADARRALDLAPDAIGADCPDVLLRLMGRG